MKELPIRKKLRLKDYNYSKVGSYFITFCVKGRHEMLSRIAIGIGSEKAPYIEITKYGTHFCNAMDFIQQNSKTISIDNYVVMPNHVHFIVSINNPSNEMSMNINSGSEIVFSPGASGVPRPTNALIPKLISSIKRYTNKQNGFDMWQTSYHDHIIRNENEYALISRYIDENPARWKVDRFYVPSSI